MSFAPDTLAYHFIVLNKIMKDVIITHKYLEFKTKTPTEFWHFSHKYKNVPSFTNFLKLDFLLEKETE